MNITLERIESLLPHKEDGTLAHGAKRELGLLLGLKSGNLVTDWFNGRRDSYKGYLAEIALHYGVSVEWLKGETDDPTPTQSSVSVARQMDRIIDGMSREELAALIVRASALLRDK